MGFLQTLLSVMLKEAYLSCWPVRSPCWPSTLLRSCPPCNPVAAGLPAVSCWLGEEGTY